MRRAVLFTALLAAGLLAACGDTGGGPSPAPRPESSPTAAPGPPVYFPSQDTPYDGASADLKRYWKPYGVGTIPGIHALDGAPPTPRVVNASGGAVPDDMAQQWGQAFTHTAAWRRWADRASQAALLGRLGAAAQTYISRVRDGDMLTEPDCALFPTSLTLLPRQEQDTATSYQFLFLATFAGAPCTTTYTAPGGAPTADDSFESRTLVEPGWIHLDPILGALWVDEKSDNCDLRCPTAASVPPVISAPARPAADTPITQAPPALQTAWQPYELQLIPGKNAIAGVPATPRLDNRTGGAISDDLAQSMALGLLRDLAWQRWALQTDTVSLLLHLAGAQVPPQAIRDAANAGAKAILPDCATFPNHLTLEPEGAHNDTGSGDQASQQTQYVFVADYASNCHVDAVYPDGHRESIPVAGSRYLYGSLRQDPLLGTIWFPLEAALPGG